MADPLHPSFQLSGGCGVPAASIHTASDHDCKTGAPGEVTGSYNSSSILGISTHDGPPLYLDRPLDLGISLEQQAPAPGMGGTA